MNREQAKKYWPFIKAYGEGKELQYRKVGEIEWHVERKHLGFCFDVDDYEFRIKPDDKPKQLEQFIGGAEEMTEQEKAKKLLPIIQAIAEEKKIQYSFNGVTWFDKDENLDLVTVCEDIILDSTDYRIKPEDTAKDKIKKYTDAWMKGEYISSEKHYRPFKDCSELIQNYVYTFDGVAEQYTADYVKTNRPLIWIKKKVCSGDERSLITAYDINCVFIQDVWIDMTELFEKYTFLDGSVCGVENEIQF